MRVRWFQTAGLVAVTTATAAAIFACGFEGGGLLSDMSDMSGPGISDGAVGGDGSSVDGSDPSTNVGIDGASGDGASGDGGAGDALAPFPESCTDVLTAADADVTLYVAHDPAKPWAAHCGPAGETYLPLPAGAANNFSSYPENNCASKASGASSTVKTTWTRVRIDPVSLIVTTNDYAGSLSTGSTHEVSGNGTIDYTYVKMPFATGRTCDDQGPASVTGKADLTGTKFQIATNQFISEGFSITAAATTTGRATALSMTAFPGGMHSCRPAATDYYQRNGGKCLQLEYAP